MDKYEYKVKADEIKELIAQGNYAQAAEIADTIDWRRIKSVMMLCTISDLYKINRRYEDARDLLLLAYERRPGGRTICYSLCELSIKTEELIQAVEYYKEFVQAAPKDPGRYILQYKIYEAQDVSLEERIEVLEELKKRDYREKWAYELAYLYHRVGLATRCVEECDEMILWFGEGKYVTKAMELKMLHQPLTPEQQEKYDNRFQAMQAEAGGQAQEGENSAGDTYEGYSDEEALAEEGSAEAYYPEEGSVEEDYAREGIVEASGQDFPFDEQDRDAAFAGGYEGDSLGDTKIYPAVKAQIEPDAVLDAAQEKPVRGTAPEEDLDIQVKTMDVHNKFNTINLQAELAAGLQEILAQETKTGEENAITRSILAPMMDGDTESLDNIAIEEVDEEDLEPEYHTEEIEGTEVFFGETGDLSDVQQKAAEEDGEALAEAQPSGLQPSDRPTSEVVEQQSSGRQTSEVVEAQPSRKQPSGRPTSEVAEPQPSGKQSLEAAEPQSSGETSPAQEPVDDTAQQVMEEFRRESLEEAAKKEVFAAQPPKELAEVLSQESDGQLSLVVPSQNPSVEKQITGQLNIEDVLAEWERMKRETAQKNEAQVRKHVLEQTGDLFAEFDAATKEGLLERLEKEADMYEANREEQSEADTLENPEEVSETEEESEISEEVPETEEESEIPEEVSETEEESEIPEEVPETEGESDIPVRETTEATAEPETEPYADENPEGEYSDNETPLTEIYAGEPSEEEFSNEEISEAETDAEVTPEEADSDWSLDEVEELEEIQEPSQAEEELPEEAVREAQEQPAEEYAVEEQTAEGQSEEEPAEASNERKEQTKTRPLTKEEKELFAPYIQSRQAREQLINVVDNISMAAYTGNVIITGEEGTDILTLAKNIIKEVKQADSNFSGKVAKISGSALNTKGVDKTILPLSGGALIIQNVSAMEDNTVEQLYHCLQQEQFGIVVILEDTRPAMERFLAKNEKLQSIFSLRMDVQALSNDTLVAYGKQYAREREYAISDLGVLALHTRIEELQTLNHAVTVIEVKDMVDEAIRHADKKNLGHFFDVLLARRYDEEDMIILGEKDFS